MLLLCACACIGTGAVECVSYKPNSDGCKGTFGIGCMTGTVGICDTAGAIDARVNVLSTSNHDSKTGGLVVDL